MARPKQESEKPLTETELQVMNVLWSLNSASVHEVQEVLSKESKKEYAYTTVSTLLRILEKKSIVKSEKLGRGHKYSPAVSQENYQNKAAKHLVENVFSGQKSALIRNLLGNNKISSEELDEIRKLLEEKAKK